MARDKNDSVQVALKVPTAWIKAADKVAEKQSSPGKKLTRTDGFRIAMALGFKAAGIKIEE